MPEFTTNFNLEKPLQNEYFDIDIQNGNMDTIDTELKNLNIQTTNLEADKVNKVVGKQLSTEDYTADEKNKLLGIENNANNYSHPSSHPATMITQDSSHRFVTDSEKSVWSNANVYTDNQVNDLAGTGRTTETIKKNSDDIGSLTGQMNTHKTSGDHDSRYHRLNVNPVILGEGATTGWSYGFSVAIGLDAHAQGANESIAIGKYCTANGNNSAIGSGAEATGNGAVALFGTALNDWEFVMGWNSTNIKIPGKLSVTGTKNFEMPHPHPNKKETHIIRHSAVEAPTAGDNLYRFTIEATDDGDVVDVVLPDYFQYLNKNVDVWVNGQGHFGRGFGEVVGDILRVTCETSGIYKVLVIGTRNDDHPSVAEWDIKGVERKIGENWNGETQMFQINEMVEIEEVK
ncbi:hypothetical protein R9X47_18200 [Wukongibacter baidiensis]|uniref:hypothetical protein n=1 Tax=Wukongibacter baidiensis TaxID=1723361 RepID=UPI003D7F9E0A